MRLILYEKDLLLTVLEGIVEGDKKRKEETEDGL